MKAAGHLEVSVTICESTKCNIPEFLILYQDCC